MERLRHNIYPEMSFPALSMSGMSDVLVGFVGHLQARRGESLGQLLGDDIASCHGLGIAGAGPVGQSGENRSPGQASAVVRRREKLVPQPQDAVACGLLMRNEALIRSSTKSISEPARYPTEV